MLSQATESVELKQALHKEQKAKEQNQLLAQQQKAALMEQLSASSELNTENQKRIDQLTQANK